MLDLEAEVEVEAVTCYNGHDSQVGRRIKRKYG
jgi:hypothetical protein